MTKVSQNPSSNDGKFIKISGPEIFNIFLQWKHPDMYKDDEFLLRAKRCAKKARASHLKDFELRAIAWFALLPELDPADEEGKQQVYNAIHNRKNLFSDVFFSLWLHDRDCVTRLLSCIREHVGHPETEQHVSDFLKYSDKSPPIDDEATKGRVKRSRKLVRPSGETAKAVKVLQTGLSGKKKESGKGQKVT